MGAAMDRRYFLSYVAGTLNQQPKGVSECWCAMGADLTAQWGFRPVPSRRTQLVRDGGGSHRSMGPSAPSRRHRPRGVHDGGGSHRSLGLPPRPVVASFPGRPIPIFSSVEKTWAGSSGKEGGSTAKEAIWQRRRGVIPEAAHVNETYDSRQWISRLSHR